MDAQKTSTPFAMSFDEIRAQAEANMQADKGQTAPAQPQVQPEAQPQAAATGGGKSFLDMVNEAQTMLNDDIKTEQAPASKEEALQETASQDAEQAAKAAGMGAPAGPSFEDMFNQAQAVPQTAGTPSFDDLFNQAQSVSGTASANGGASFAEIMAQAQIDAGSQPKEEAGQQTGGMPSFDEMMAQAQGTTQPAETGNTKPSVPSFDELMVQAQAQTAAAEKPAKEEVPVEEPAKEDASVEESPKVEAPAEESVKEDAPAEETAEQFMNEPVQEEQPKAEEPAKEAKGGKSGGKKNKKKVEEEEQKEPLPDITNEFKVDVKGGDKSEDTPVTESAVKGESAEGNTPAVVPKTEGQLSMETLFTPDEIAAFRADIRTFVRKEFKTAMVGAMKELLTEFSE